MTRLTRPGPTRGATRTVKTTLLGAVLTLLGVLFVSGCAPTDAQLDGMIQDGQTRVGAFMALNAEIDQAEAELEQLATDPNSSPEDQARAEQLAARLADSKVARAKIAAEVQTAADEIAAAGSAQERQDAWLTGLLSVAGAIGIPGAGVGGVLVRRRLKHWRQTVGGMIDAIEDVKAATPDIPGAMVLDKQQLAEAMDEAGVLRTVQTERAKRGA